MKNIFEILAIENKELPVSNLMAWLFDSDEDHGLGRLGMDEFCIAAKIAPIDNKSKITITREYQSKLKIDEKIFTNFIDILIRIGNIENPDRIICIENKINSKEGYQQTERYRLCVEKDFPNCQDIQYIYLTMNNSSLVLSDLNFIHVKYIDLKFFFEKVYFKNIPVVNDFYERYILRDEQWAKDIDEHNCGLSKNNFEELVNYIVYKMNYQHNNIYCAGEKSDLSQSVFFKCTIQDGCLI